MSGNKYLKIASGVIGEQAAIQSSTGVTDAGKIPALDSTGRLDSTMMPVGVAPEVKILNCSEVLAAGDFVNIYNDTTAKCRKADATTAGKEANGYVLAAVDNGNPATIYVDSINSQLSALTPGAVYYLAATPAGGATATAPSGSGNVVQRLGRALSATEIAFEPGDPITLA
ncbi:MAG: hypothetical protein O8C67_06095 [Candidatus Methanoperedens sp.]|nr:hypothetical protein [Candidatus Methanoperedens sp.]